MCLSFYIVTIPYHGHRHSSHSNSANLKNGWFAQAHVYSACIVCDGLNIFRESIIYVPKPSLLIRFF